MEQLTLFDNPSPADELAKVICDELNRQDTVWQGTFHIQKVELIRWEHISDPLKVLTIVLKPDISKSYLVHFKGDKKSQEAIQYLGDHSQIIGKMMEDKDFTFNLTPWMALVFWHKFEKKTPFLKKIGVIQ